MAWLADTSQYTRAVRDPDSGDEAEVTFRVLNAHDSALIEDEIVLMEGASGADEMKPLMGTRTLMTVKQAVVTWTLPLPCTTDIIGQLHPGLIAQMFAHASFGSRPADPTPPAKPAIAETVEELVEPLVAASSSSIKPTSSAASTDEYRADL